MTGKKSIPGSEGEGQEVTYVSQFVAITTGHHAKPTWPKFKGEETFTGRKLYDWLIGKLIYSSVVRLSYVAEELPIITIRGNVWDEEFKN